jgi:tetratricopeptide (TPR) repeat protein
LELINKKDLKEYLNKKKINKQQDLFGQGMIDNSFLNDAIEGLQEWEILSTTPMGELENDLDTRIDDAVNDKSHEIKTVARMPIFKIIAVAAGIIGILFLTLIYIHNQRMSTGDLYKQYFKVLTHPDKAVKSEQDTITEKDNTLKAVSYYEQENYKEAIYHYKEAIAKDPDNDKNQLFLGISYLADNEPNEAIKVLFTYDFPKSKYIQDRDWYLALAYLKIKDVPNAKILFEKLSNEDSYYQNLSKDMLQSLNDKNL